MTTYKFDLEDYNKRLKILAKALYSISGKRLYSLGNNNQLVPYKKGE